MYHQVGEFASPKAHRASFCHIKRFKQQMAWLKTADHHVISLDDACNGLFGDMVLPPRSVVLTFDDGCANFREYALPVLRKHAYPSTMFLIGGMLGKTTSWMKDVGVQSRLMDSHEIKEIHAAGDVTFGSHTMSHVRLAQCDAAVAKREIFESKMCLEEMLGSEVGHFCYPYGSYNEPVRDWVSEAGYRSGLTCIRGLANHAQNAYEIPRKAISYGDNVLGFWWKLLKKR